MRFTLIVALFLTLALPCVANAQQPKKPRPNSRTTVAPQTPQPRPSSPPRMSPEKAFYYFVAINGYSDVDVYGKSFDASNYERAMADEFERNRYRERIRARIADEVRKIDFSEKFTFVAQARLGEYSFGSHSFPIVWLGEWLRICIGPQSYTGDCTFLEASGFRVQDAVNGNDFNWSLPMSEGDASAFVKSRSTARPGEVDRHITVRITYSVVNKRPAFSPFIYSVEAYNDKSLTAKLGVIPKINSLGPSTAEELRLATVAAQTATKEIGKYQRAKSNYQEKSDGKIHDPFKPVPPRPKLSGTVTLTDVGVTFSDEQPDGSYKTESFSFFDAFTNLRAYYRAYWPSNTPTFDLYRSNWKGDSFVTHGESYSVTSYPNRSYRSGFAASFTTTRERDRYFVDLTRSLQEWKTKYAPFQFSEGKVNIDQRCAVNDRFIPCSESTPFEVP